MKTAKNTLALCKILQSQGFGTRKECCRLIWDGYVSVQGEIQTDANQEFSPQNFQFKVGQKDWIYKPKLYLKMNKPAGYECTRLSGFHETVMALIPPQFSTRGVQTAGRLDVDTSGLLLLSDDGQFLHHITSPKKEIPKTYKVMLKHAVDESFVNILKEGVELRAEKEVFKAVDAVLVSPQILEMTIAEGKFHQVKRMVAAAGNRVESLSRVSIASLQLGDLPEGKWVELSAEELNLLGYQV